MPGNDFAGYMSMGLAEEDERAPKPKKVAKDVVTGMKDYLPGYMDLLRSQIYPTELAYLQAEQGVGRPRQKMYANLYSKFAPQYAQTQQELENIASEGELQRILGSGGQGALASELIAQQAARTADPEYYNLRELTANRLTEMLNKGLTNSEVEAITRGQNRMNFSTGVNEVPSSMSTIGNAMQFGGAARDRLGQAIQLATQAFPTMKTSTMSGNEMFSAASGRGRNINQNMQAFNTGVTGDAMGFGETFGNNLFGAKNNQMNIDANRRTVGDRFNQWTSSIGNLASTGSSMAGAFKK